MNDDPQTIRAIARLELCERVLPELLGALGALKRRAVEAAERQGISSRAWAAMSYTERESVLAKDRPQRRGKTARS